MGQYVKGKGPLCPMCRTNEIRDRQAQKCGECNRRPGWHLPRPDVPAAPTPLTNVVTKPLAESVQAALKQPLSIDQIADKCSATQGQVLDALLGLQARGVNVHRFGELWSLERAPVLGSHEVAGAYVSRPNGRYRFGWLGDSHLGSKYARLDCLQDLYRRFADADIDRIFHAGNWIDGEARFNKFDLLPGCHGMDAQIQYLVENYPVAPNGLKTYAIAGDDHEGWYCQREGVDIGKYAERAMVDAGRTDWVNMGYMEAFVPLQHAETGKTAQLHLVHPGGGSAYATSYTVQKLVESYPGGSKPAVLLAGHYHKLEYLCTRNVHCIQTGCTQDQTPFARKKRLQFALGGGICELEQDAETGAIVSCLVQVFNYFDAGFYTNDRFSHSAAINLPPVSRGGVGLALR
jgi:hypothetical protein